jgi:hypothetical protein
LRMVSFPMLRWEGLSPAEDGGANVQLTYSAWLNGDEAGVMFLLMGKLDGLRPRHTWSSWWAPSTLGRVRRTDIRLRLPQANWRAGRRQCEGFRLPR